MTLIEKLDILIVLFAYVMLGVLFLKVVFFIALSNKHYQSRNYIKNKRLYKKNPLVSVIVPCYNEGLTLQNCIKSLVTQSYKNIEIIVVDDGSTDNTLQVAKKLEDKYKLQLKAVTKQNGGKASALNYGINIARGEYVVCIDADSVFLKNTVKQLIKPFFLQNLVAVGGNVRVANRKKILNKHQAMEYISGLGIQRRAFAHLECMQVISGAIGAFRKDKLEEIGGYSTDTIVEDMDVTISLQKAGGKVDYNPHAIAYTEAPENINSFIKQRYRWTFGGFQVLRKHKDMLFNPRYGMLGLIGLPYFLIFTWIDVLISLLFIVSITKVLLLGNIFNFLVFYVCMVTLQGSLLLYALIRDKENLKLGLTASIDSLWYNHIISYTSVKAGIGYLLGFKVKWDKLERLGKNYITPIKISIPNTRSSIFTNLVSLIRK